MVERRPRTSRDKSPFGSHKSHLDFVLQQYVSYPIPGVRGNATDSNSLAKPHNETRVRVK